MDLHVEQLAPNYGVRGALWAFPAKSGRASSWNRIW